MIDRCSRLGAIFRAVAQLAPPGMAATSLIAFLAAWGEFPFAYILTSPENTRVMAVALHLFIPSSMESASWGLLFAMAAIFVRPVLLLFARL